MQINCVLILQTVNMAANKEVPTMKLTDELKEKIDAAESIEEKKAILEEAGVEISDDELDEVSGGIRRRDVKNNRLPR